MHIHMTTYGWWLAGRYGALGIVAGVGWLARQRWLPHRHDGYESMNGYVHACGRCGRLPAGAFHTGFNGMIGPDGYDVHGYDADGFDRAGLDKHGHDRAYWDLMRRSFRVGWGMGPRESDVTIYTDFPDEDDEMP